MPFLPLYLLLSAVRWRLMHSVFCPVGHSDSCVAKSRSPWPCRTLSQVPDLPAPAGPPDLPGKLSEMLPDGPVDLASSHGTRGLHREQGPGLRVSMPSLCHCTTSCCGPCYREGDRGSALRAVVGSHGRQGRGSTWGVALDCSVEGGWGRPGPGVASQQGSGSPS